MKIAIIQNVTLNDHRSVHSHNIACELVKRGHTIDCILQKTNDQLQYNDRPYNLIHIPGDTYSITGQLRFMIASWNVIQNGKYDIIHAKNPFSSLWSPVILKKMKRIRSTLIYDMRGLWIDFGVGAHQFPPFLAVFLKKCEKILADRCDGLIAISPTLKDILCERGYKKEKIFVIVGAGVNIENFHKIHSLSIQKKKSDDTIIGYVGTIRTARQSEKIIEAFTIVKKIISLKHEHSENDIKLVMIGPIIEPEIFNTATSDPSIQLTGFLPQEEALGRLTTFDIAVSYHDSDDPQYTVAVPTKILEYMAAGVPIVATDHAMYTNILKNEKTALLTKQNPEDFARGIIRLLETPRMAAQLAAHAHQDVYRYSVKAIVDQLEAVYEKLYTG